MNWRAFGIGFVWGLMLYLLIYSCSAKAETLDCKTHKLYCKIVQFNPRIDRAEAMNLSNKIYSKAKLNGVDPTIALAILEHESGLRNLNTYKTTTKVTESCNNEGCIKTVVETNKAFDLSISQINVNTAIDYGFNIERLYKGDVDYALDCFMVILKSKIKLCNKLGKSPAYSCYHSVNDEYRLIYVDLVNALL